MTETPPMDPNGRSAIRDDEEEDDDDEEDDEAGGDDDDEYDDQLEDGNGNAEEHQRRIDFEKQMMEGKTGQNNSAMMTPIQGVSSSMMNSQFAADISGESPINKKESI